MLYVDLPEESSDGLDAQDSGLTSSAVLWGELSSRELPNRSRMKLRFYFSLQVHNIAQSAGEMEVSSRFVAVIRFPSQRAHAETLCHLTWSYITVISLDSNHCVNKSAGYVHKFSPVTLNLHQSLRNAWIFDACTFYS